jgi:hypothetical protein
VRLRLTVEWAHEAQGNSRFGRRRSNRFTINIGKDHLRDLSVGGAISYSVFEPLANERSSCVKQLLDYLRSRSAGRSQGRPKPARYKASRPRSKPSNLSHQAGRELGDERQRLVAPQLIWRSSLVSL